MKNIIAEILGNIYGLEQKQLVIFGTGMGSRRLIPLLPVKIKYLVDNDCRKWDTTFCDYRICNPETLVNEDRDRLCILVMSSYYKEISQQLLNYGFVEKVHFMDGFRLFDRIMPYLMAAKQEDIIAKFPDLRLLGNVMIDEASTFEGCNAVHANAQILRSKIGAYTYVSTNTRIYNSSIGRFCSIGPDVLIGLGRHPSKGMISTYPAFFSKNNTGCMQSFVDEQLFEESLPVEIGNDVWIGARAIIADGVHIGDGAIIGAGAVVSRDVDSYAIVGGVPAKIIRKRYSSEQIDKLIQFKWWNKDIAWIREHAQLYSSEEKFFQLLDMLPDGAE